MHLNLRINSKYLELSFKNNPKHMKLNIITYPHKLLRTKLDKVQNFNDSELNQVIKEMIRLMIKYDGIGLAGNQTGINKRIIIVNDHGVPQAYINPQIKRKSLVRQKIEEGCISFPEIMGYVYRSKVIILEYYDPQGKKHKTKLRGLYSTVFQHEVDHINGIIFTDKIKKFTAGEEKFRELRSRAKEDEK